MADWEMLGDSSSLPLPMCSTPSQAISNYGSSDTWLAMNAKTTPTTPFVATSPTGDSIPFFIKIGNPCSTIAKDWRKANQAEIRCNSCTSNLGLLLHLLGPANVPFTLLDDNDAYSPLEQLFDLYQRDTPTGVYFPTSEIVGDKGTEQYPHFHTIIDATHFASESLAIDYTRLLHKYVPIVRSIFDKHCVQELPATIDFVLKLLTTTSMGEHCRFGLTWLKKVNDPEWQHKSRVEQYRILVCAILSLKFDKGMTAGDFIIPVIHQLHNTILPLIENATSREALKASITSMFHPLTYRRPTAAPSAGAVEIAMNELGDFTNRVMTVDEASLNHGMVLVPATVSGITTSRDAFAQMKKAATSSPNPRGASKFMTHINNDQPIATSLRVLLEKPPAGLQVNIENLCPGFAVSTTLPVEKLCVPHLWAFSQRKCSPPMGTEWKDVVGILPLSHGISQTFLLVCHGMRPHSTTGGCFPAFLSTKLTRICDSAFERCNTTMLLPNIADPNLAVGVGASVVDATSRLSHTFKFRLKGSSTVVNISSFYLSSVWSNNK
jgi:hypothetical protein